MAKPKLSDFSQHCGECKFCHQLREDKKRVGCYVNPPEFIYGDEEDKHYSECSETYVNRPHCRHFVSKQGIN